MPSTLPQRNFRFYPEDLERIERIKKHIESLGLAGTEADALRFALRFTVDRLPPAEPPPPPKKSRKKSSGGS